MTQAVERFLGAHDNESADGPALTVAALYSVYTDRMAELLARLLIGEPLAQCLV